MDMSVKKILAYRVHQLREARGFEGRGGKIRFCEMAHISRPQFDLIERGDADVKIETLAKLASALDVDAYELLMPLEEGELPINMERFYNVNKKPLKR